MTPGEDHRPKISRLYRVQDLQLTLKQYWQYKFRVSSLTRRYLTEAILELRAPCCSAKLPSDLLGILDELRRSLASHVLQPNQEL